MVLADFTITISNSVRSWGPQPTTKWGSAAGMTWGSSKWGYAGGGLSPTKSLAFTMTVASETTMEGLEDQAGYDYLFPAPSTDAEDRANTTWTEVGING